MWFINQTLSFYRFCSLFSKVSTRESSFASLIQSVNLITVAHTSTVKVHGRFCHLFILFLKQQIIRSTSSEYNKYIFPLFSILNYYISKVVYNRFIMKSFLPFSVLQFRFSFPVAHECSTTAGGVSVQIRGRGYPSHLLVLIRGLSPVRIRRWNRPQWNHVFPSVLRRVEVGPSVSRAGAGRALSAVERDGAAASALDRWIGRDVPAHLHPTRDRRGAAEAGVPGRREKSILTVSSCRIKVVLPQSCLHLANAFDFFFFASVHSLLMRIRGVISQPEVLQFNGKNLIYWKRNDLGLLII